MPLTIDARKLLAWNDETAQKFFRFIAQHPAVFTLPCDIRNSESVADMLQHIVAVELRYAQRLSGLPESSYDDIPKGSINDIEDTHKAALHLLEPLLDDGAFDWTQQLTFRTITMGDLQSSRESILLHLTLHSIRHYAQLATLLRQHGHELDWPLDYLFAQAARS